MVSIPKGKPLCNKSAASLANKKPDLRGDPALKAFAELWPQFLSKMESILIFIPDRGMLTVMDHVKEYWDQDRAQ